MKVAALKVGMVVRCTASLNSAWLDGDMTITRVDPVGKDADHGYIGRSYVEALHDTRGTGGFYVGDGDMIATAPVDGRVKSGTQMDKVLRLTLGQGSWTLSSIAAATGASEAAASARLRDIRALGYTVTCSKPAGEKLRRYTVRSEVIVSA